MHIQITTKKPPLKQKTQRRSHESSKSDLERQLNLFDDTTELELHGVLLPGPIYQGSPHLYGCWSCFAQRLWTHLIDWGNSRGPAVALPICNRCYRKRSRLTPSDRLLFDQACRQNAVEKLGGMIACQA